MRTQRIFTLIMFVLAFTLATAGLAWDYTDTAVAQDDETDLVITVDHSEFTVLQQEFETGPDVTAACLSCHSGAAQEIMATAHWTWEYEHPETGQLLGKKNVINNFCIAIQSNEPRCTSCHAGYGWADETFDFNEETNVDCLACHDTTGTYAKFPTAAGHPTYEDKEFPAGSGNIWVAPDLMEVAQNVGPTSRQTCGSCHFYGGGDDGVKHGDMDSSLTNPSYALDVHMSPDGADFNCTDCHQSEGHVVSGSRYSMNSTDEETCESCHTNEPHLYDMLNAHNDRIACQTCHIPEYARGGVPTKMDWDWSTAGDLNPDGSIKLIRDESGHLVYDSRKGTFVQGENMEPVYIWFSGDLDYTLLEDRINPNGVTTINAPQGDISDPDARIWPMKLFTAIQPYDSGNNTLVIPHLFGQDDAAYWKSFEWGPAIEAGMAATDVPYSGQYGFTETQMYWPLTHMIAPASEALQCNECHTPDNGRIDFVALGYDEDAAYRLTHFPPNLSAEQFSAPENAPSTCAECHANEHTDWVASYHGEGGVGCVTCHELEGGSMAGSGEANNQHPTVAYNINRSPDLCGTCHLDEHRDWDMSAHANEEKPIECLDCHIAHTQQQRMDLGHQTSCESCHKEPVDMVAHSTHGVAALNCLDCHKNTHENTGHTFLVASDTCLLCHGEEAHTANKMVEAGVELALRPPVDGKQGDDHIEMADVSSVGILGIPDWFLAIPALIVILGGVWVWKGKDPGHDHPENQNHE